MGRKKRTYADGQPFDDIHCLQAKLLLKPDRFSAANRFADFGKVVERTARSMKVGAIEDAEPGRGPRVREVIFIDTPDFRLYHNGFIFRRRARYVDGFPAGDPEIVFKFRYPDARRAAATDVRPNISGKYRIKFKQQALPSNDRLGGYRLLYSHNCQFGLSQVHDGVRTSMRTLVRIRDCESSDDPLDTRIDAQLQALSLLRREFAAATYAASLDFHRHDASYPEIVHWTVDGVRFVGLNVPGPDDNRRDGYEREYVRRGRANLAEVNAAFDDAAHSSAARPIRGIMIIFRRGPFSATQSKKDRSQRTRRSPI